MMEMKGREGVYGDEITKLDGLFWLYLYTYCMSLSIWKSLEFFRPSKSFPHINSNQT